jgi:hypothetical protein
MASRPNTKSAEFCGPFVVAVGAGTSTKSRYAPSCAIKSATQAKSESTSSARRKIAKCYCLCYNWLEAVGDTGGENRRGRAVGRLSAPGGVQLQQHGSDLAEPEPSTDSDPEPADTHVQTQRDELSRRFRGLPADGTVQVDIKIYGYALTVTCRASPPIRVTGSICTPAAVQHRTSN